MDSRQPTTDNALLFSAEDRQQVLDAMVALLRADARVAGAILVGSGAYGFRDRFSDIDLCVVVTDAEDVFPAFREFGAAIARQLPILQQRESPRGNNSYLHIVLLENYLECDIGFVALDNLRATRKHWQVIYDHSAQLEPLMAASWAETAAPASVRERYQPLLHDSWYYIIHAAVAVRRHEPWRALTMLEDIRRHTIDLRGIRDGYETKMGREVDVLPASFLNRLTASLPTSLDGQEILRALGVAVELFYNEVRELEQLHGGDHATVLQERMTAFVELIAGGG